MAGPNSGIRTVTNKSTTVAENAEIVTGTDSGNGKRALDVSPTENGLITDWDNTTWTQLTTQATPNYSNLDLLGSNSGDAVEITNVFDFAGQYGLLLGAEVIDDDKIKPAMDLHLFAAEPDLSNGSGENNALVIDTADWKKRCGMVQINIGHYAVEDSSHVIADVTINGPPPHPNLQLIKSESTSLWLAGQARDTLNFATTDALSVRFKIKKL